ncbi:MAG TPA: quinone-dependent dihydroorotate dehydrogenase [Nocardioides sp.]|uniref:quinone-dependent dihydroorotate dehydrogenase n=1 Tax=Nocardioides sp. TaxID=35761 RepID=UPI002F429EC2
MTAYDVLFRGVLTRIDPERAHRLGFRAIRTGRPAARAVVKVPAAPVEAMGLRFGNPLGLAAGFDKNAVGIDALAALGFGFVEVGTVTARPQPGNPRPRLFRLPDDHAVINRMGFNNDGAEAVAGRLQRRTRRLDRRDRRARVNLRDRRSHTARPVLGINIGKSKVVPDDDERAVLRDYATSARLLAPYADYLVVNVSSPNTPGLRNLQAVDRLAPLLDEVRRVADEAAHHPVPLCVKIAPDLADEDVVAVGKLARECGLEGLIATNTTISRDGLLTPAAEVAAVGAGGLSGPVLRRRSVEVLRLLRQHDPEITLISVGGVTTGHDVQERLRTGATLVQAYTGFVYGGPLWPRRVLRELTR